MLPLSAVALLPVAPCGLPLALGCQRLWRLGYRRTAWTAGVVLGVVTVAASLVAGLLGPLAIAVYAVILSLPVWVAGWWLNRSGLNPLESGPAAQQGGGRQTLPPVGPAPPAAGRQYVLPAAGRRHVQARPPALTPRQLESPSRERLR